MPSDMDGYSDLKCEICHQHQHPIQGTLFWRCSRCGRMHHDECVVLQPEFDANGLPTRFGCTKCRTPWFLRSELCCTGDCGEENGPEGADVDESLDLPEQRQPPVAPEVQRGYRQLGSHIPMSDRLEPSDELLSPRNMPCDIRTSSKAKIKRRRQRKHLYYKCPHCPSRYSWETSLSQHLRGKHPKDPSRCQWCRMWLPTIAAREAHEANAHRRQPCLKCGEWFSGLDWLEFHTARCPSDTK